MPALAVGELKARAGDGEMHGAAAGMEFNLSGGRAHALAAANDGGEVFKALGGQQGIEFFAAQAGILAQAHEDGKGAIGLEHACRRHRA